MDENVVDQLLSINREFYSRFANSFAESRSHVPPGFYKLADYFPDHPVNVLDVGCGEGRFGRFVAENHLLMSYTGVDFSQELARVAAASLSGTFEIRDLNQSDCLVGLDLFDIVACLATLQHIPGRESRIRLLSEMGNHLRLGGQIFLSNWQFLDSQRQMKKVIAWSNVGLKSEDVEEQDYLLTWHRGGYGVRYVSSIGQEEMIHLAEAADLEVVGQFRSDGREGDLNLYSVLRKRSRD
jgi:2-polyprenyl-3-methyl-5-hydroxy-6-metoxy-1,4-benzoquinol methylase